MNLYLLEKYEDRIKSGDQIIWGGTDSISDIIENVTKSPYSHISTCIWFKLVDELPPKLFVIESTTLNSVKDFDGTTRKGVSMVLLSQKLESFKGQAWWLPLKVPYNTEEKNNVLTWLFQKYASKDTYSLANCIAAGVNNPKIPKIASIFLHPFFWLFYNKATQRKYFCSELSTRGLQIGNRVSESINSILQTPAMVAQFSCFDKPVKITGD